MILATPLLLGAAARESTVRRAAPDQVGLSVARLARVTAAIERQIDAGTVTGVVAAVARRGAIVLLEARGVDHTGPTRALAPGSAFSTAAMTQPVVAAGVLMLVDDGRVRLDDPVSRFVPAFQRMRVIDTNPPWGLSAGDAPWLNTAAADREVTIQDLLTHKAGLGCGSVSLGEIERLARVTPKSVPGETVVSFGSVPLEHQPGARWCYSPFAATETLLRIIETASGESTGQFFSGQIFRKLGMNDTSVEYATAASPHELGHHEVVTSAEDIVKFGLMLLNRGELNGVRILGSRTIEMMRYPYVKEFDSPVDGRKSGRTFGLGVQVVNDPNAAGYSVGVGTFGWSDDHLTTTHFWIDPTERIVGVVLVAGHSVALVRDIEAAVLHSIVD